MNIKEFRLTTGTQWFKLSALRGLSVQILFNLQTLSEQQLFPIGHFFGMGYQMLQFASREHNSNKTQ